MKKWMMLIMLFSASTLWAYTFEVGEFEYTRTNFAEPYTVAVSGFYKTYSGHMEIPSSVTNDGITYTVTSIKANAFGYYFPCDELTSVTIPNTVESIEKNAFSNCKSLTTISIPQSVIRIDEGAFDNTAWYNNQADGVVYAGKVAYAYKGNMPLNTSITLKSGTVGITAYAFSGNSNLVSISIPNSVVTIGEKAFYDTGIYNNAAKWSNNVLYIDNCLICINDNISTDYTIKSNTRLIADKAFNIEYMSNNISSITIPETVKNIGIAAFEDCTNLDKTNYIGSLESWCKIKFSDATANPSCYSHNLYIKNQKQVDITIPSSITKILSYTFYHAGLESITLHNNVIEIGKWAFYYNNFTTVTIPGNVTSIGDGSFALCRKLTSFSCGSKVKSIGSECFLLCESLASIKIGNNVKTIGVECFEDCSSLTSITLGDKVQHIGAYAFRDCKSLSSITIPTSVKVIECYPFDECSSLNKVKYAGDVADWCKIKFCHEESNPMGRVEDFYFNNSKITKLSIPNTVDSIPSYAFYGGPFTSVSLGDNVKSIGNHAFTYCTKLTSLTCGQNVKTIGDGAFYDCTSLTKIVLNNVETIGKSAFSNCLSIQGTITLGSVKNIGNSAFYGCTSLTKIILNNVETIGESAFRDCSSLATIEFSNSNTITAIREKAFNGTAYYTNENNWQNNVLYIDNCLIEAKKELSEEYIINKGTRLIADKSFKAPYVYYITIPKSVKFIGAEAFANTYLFEVTCEPIDVPQTALSAFGSEINYSVLYVNGASLSAYKSTEPWDRFYTIKSIAGTEVIPVMGITLDQSTYALYQGDEEQALIAEVWPTNANNQNVTWTSSNPRIVSVRTDKDNSKIGYLSAFEEGDVIITATTEDGGFTAICEVTVMPNPESSVDNTLTQQKKLRKVIEHQQLFIILPDGTKYSATGQRI